MFFSLLSSAIFMSSTIFSQMPISPQLNVNLSPSEGWTVQLGAPIFWGNTGALPTVGVNVNRNFPLGKSLGWSEAAERISLGVGANAFAPVNFHKFYLGASAGLSHYTPFDGWMLDYGLRYAPLVAVDFVANNTTGYNGLFANIGVHFQVIPNTWATLGLQGGFYSAFTHANLSPLWMFQPIVGINSSF